MIYSKDDVKRMLQVIREEVTGIPYPKVNGVWLWIDSEKLEAKLKEIEETL